MFKDEFGRARIFHGINVVYKLPPFIPQQQGFDPLLSFSEKDIPYLKKFGFNLVRLGVIWEAVETGPGVYDEVYLNIIRDTIEMLGKNGIYTIVDSHQDIMTRYLCGEGIPDFYIKDLKYDKDCNGSYFKKFLHMINVCKSASEYNFPVDDQGKPLINTCKKHFVDLNVSPDVTSLFDKLYKNENGLLDNYINFWGVLAKKFKGNPYVLGYDIWNEPFPGAIFDNLSLLKPGRSDDVQLLPFYRKIDQSIRKVDDSYIMMFEPMNFPDIIPITPNWLISGTFSEPPLTPDYNNRQVFNIHTYCCSMGYNICKDGEPHLDQADNCKKFHTRKLGDANEFATKNNIPLILTEFGACMNTEACYQEITTVTSLADKYLTSWTYWMYKPFNDFATTCQPDQEGMFHADGTIQDYKERALTRTYMSSFQGEPVSVNFNEETKEFTAEFIYNSDIKQGSDIYLNLALNYPNGVAYEVVGPQQMTWVQYSDNNYVLDINSSDVKLIKLRIFPKGKDIRGEGFYKKVVIRKDDRIIEISKKIK